MPFFLCFLSYCVYFRFLSPQVSPEPSKEVSLVKPPEPGGTLRSLPEFDAISDSLEKGLGVWWCFLLWNNMWLKPCNSDKSTFLVKKLLYFSKMQNLCEFLAHLAAMGETIQKLEVVLSYNRWLGWFFSFRNSSNFSFYQLLSA